MKTKGTTLILGYPSVLSELVCISMLENEHPVFLLVAADDLSSAAHLKKKFGKQLQLLAGRDNALDFGLSGADYLQLASEVSYLLSLPSAAGDAPTPDAASVFSQEIIEFANVCKTLRHIVCISDFSFATGFSGVVAEHDLSLFNARQQAAFFSYRLERILQRFSATFPITVIRSGTLVGTFDSLCPLVMLSLGYPELFEKNRDAAIVLTDVNWAARVISSLLVETTCPHTLHLFNEIAPLRSLCARLTQSAMSQVPRSYDLKAAAKRHLRASGFDVRRFSAVQTAALIQNTWTNDYFRAHNLPLSENTLDWMPLVENDVERLTGFR